LITGSLKDSHKQIRNTWEVLHPEQLITQKTTPNFKLTWWWRTAKGMK